MEQIDRHITAARPAPRPSASAKSTGAKPGVRDLVGRRLADVERDLVLETMTRCAGNRTWAADILGLPPQELRDRLVAYNRDAEEEARAIAGRQAEIEADRHMGEGPRATYLPSVTFLA